MLKNRFHNGPSSLLGSTVLALLGLGAACSHAKQEDAGSGGSAGRAHLPAGSDPIPRRQGGSAAGSGGTDGSGGSDVGGNSGSGGMVVAPLSFDCGGELPNQPLITSFDGFTQDVWTSPGNLEGSVYLYPELLRLTPAEALHFEAQVGDYSGVGVQFASCIDASKFRGVRFSVSGDVGASGTVQLYAISNRDRDVDERNRVGACQPSEPTNPWLDCHPPGVTLPVTAEATTRSIPWAAFKGGLPTATTDGSDILALQWSFVWEASMDPYPAKLVIDDLRFFAEDEVVSGSAGAGGEGGGR